MRRTWWVPLLPLLATCGERPAVPGGVLESSPTDYVAQAVVRLPGCHGVVVRDRRTVLTAAHCVRRPAQVMRVWLADGREREARVVWLDRRGDMALVRLSRPVRVTPLEVATRVPLPGEPLWFPGTQRSAPQAVVLRRLARCASLPRVSDALFTDLSARPGDSGTPLVDSHWRVVGVVHGGARCHIAAPTARLGRMMHERPDRLARVPPAGRG